MDQSKANIIAGTANWFLGAIKRAITFDLTFRTSEAKQSESGTSAVVEEINERIPEIIAEVQNDVKIVKKSKKMPKKLSKAAKLAQEKDLAEFMKLIAEQSTDVQLFDDETTHQCHSFLTNERSQLQAEKSELEKRLYEQLKSNFQMLSPAFESLQSFLNGTSTEQPDVGTQKIILNQLREEFNAIEFMLMHFDSGSNAGEIGERTKKLLNELNGLRGKVDVALEETMKAPPAPKKPKPPKNLPPKLPDKEGQLDGLDMAVWETALKQLKVILEKPSEKKKKVKVCCKHCNHSVELKVPDGSEEQAKESSSK